MRVILVASGEAALRPFELASPLALPEPYDHDVVLLAYDLDEVNMLDLENVLDPEGALCSARPARARLLAFRHSDRGLDLDDQVLRDDEDGGAVLQDDVPWVLTTSCGPSSWLVVAVDLLRLLVHLKDVVEVADIQLGLDLRDHGNPEGVELVVGAYDAVNFVEGSRSPDAVSELELMCALRLVVQSLRRLCNDVDSSADGLGDEASRTTCSAGDEAVEATGTGSLHGLGESVADAGVDRGFRARKAFLHSISCRLGLVAALLKVLGGDELIVVAQGERPLADALADLGHGTHGRHQAVLNQGSRSCEEAILHVHDATVLHSLVGLHEEVGDSSSDVAHEARRVADEVAGAQEPQSAELERLLVKVGQLVHHFIAFAEEVADVQAIHLELHVLEGAEEEDLPHNLLSQGSEDLDHPILLDIFVHLGVSIALLVLQDPPDLGIIIEVGVLIGPFASLLVQPLVDRAHEQLRRTRLILPDE